MRNVRFKIPLLIIAGLLSAVVSMEAQTQLQPMSGMTQPQMAGDGVVSAPGQLSGSGSPFSSKRTITPVAVKGARNATMSSGGSGAAIMPFQTTSTRTKRGSSSGGFSGGNAAGGLMSSGSRYASSPAGGGSGTSLNSPSTPSRPRRVGKDDEIDEPFPDPETPIGDALWPMMALACAYALARAFLKYLLYRKKQ